MLQLYHHGEDIAVNVHIANNSNRTVKKIKVTGQSVMW
jgi:beta-arrestin